MWIKESICPVLFSTFASRGVGQEPSCSKSTSSYFFLEYIFGIIISVSQSNFGKIDDFRCVQEPVVGQSGAGSARVLSPVGTANQQGMVETGPPCIVRTHSRSGAARDAKMRSFE